MNQLCVAVDHSQSIYLPMSYELVDEVLESWSSAHQLQVSTEYKGEPVRSIQIVGAKDSRIQIWVDPVSPAGIVSVHVWDYYRRRKEFSGPVGDLNRLLEGAYQLATRWLDQPNGNR
jgi:hypothetical protein